MPSKICTSCNFRKISVSKKYCEVCSVKYDKQQKKRHKDYQKNRTDHKAQSFYNTDAWTRKRDIVKDKDNGLCLLCRDYMHTVHHIEELKEDWSKRLDEENLVSLCESCHQIIHKRYKISQNEKKKAQKELRNSIKEYRIKEDEDIL